MLLPFETALERPGEDAIPLSEKPVWKALVALGGGDGDGKRHHVQTPFHRLIHIANGGLVVADDQKLELRYELKKVLTHETGRDLVAPGQRFELAFSPPAALLSLNRGHDPRTPQPRHIGRMAVAVARHEHVHGRNGGVVAENLRQRVGKDRFTVGPCTVEEEKRVL